MGLEKISEMAWLVFLFLVVPRMMLTALAADIHYAIQEESPPGTLIGNVPEAMNIANLVSQANLPYLRYSFLSGDSSFQNYFTLDAKTGDLKLSSTGLLDREVLCQFDATCVIDLQVAVQSIQSQFFRKLLVSVDVIDINDNAPQFKENYTTLTVSELVQVPSSFPLPSALDRDTGENNSLQSYEIVPQEGPFELSYSKSNPNLMLRVIKELDHETQDKYSIKIIARDGGVPPREGILFADIFVEDVNDNAPVFTSSYAKVVDEKVSPGTVLLTLTATDKDSGKNGQVRYSLSSRQPESILSMFKIDERTGELRVIGNFQKVNTEVYKIEVEASDMGDPPFTTKTTVNITVENTINNPPKIGISYFSSNEYSSISEYANLGVAVALIQVTDSDRGPNGIVHCNLTNRGYFELQSYDVKEYKVIVAKPLDRETISVHNVTVECYDAGTPVLSTSRTFQVRVTDENDNVPVFVEKLNNISVKENNEIGAQVATVRAVDQDDPSTGNGRVTYSLVGVSENELTIDPVTGVIRAVTSFDFEKKQVVNFTVVAEDSGVPKRSSTMVVCLKILDENDQVPYFVQSRFSMRVSESAKPGERIGELTACDFEEGDNGRFDITLQPGSGRIKTARAGTRKTGSKEEDFNYEGIDDRYLPFVIRPNGSLILKELIDYEAISSYEFEVKVTDRGVPPLSETATVVVDVTDENDNPPTILHPNVSEVVLAALTGSDAPETLMTFEVVDRDSGLNGLVKFDITARNDSSRFRIDSSTGDVRRTKVFTGQDSGTYKLTIIVYDEGNPPLSDMRTVVIHVVGGNGTASLPRTGNDQYIVIAVTLVCITILLSVTIVLVIVIMRRIDRRRKSAGHGGPGGPMQFQNARVCTGFSDPIKLDNFGHENGGDYRDDDAGSLDKKDMNDSRFGFSSSNGSLTKSNTGGDNHQVMDGQFQPNQVNDLNLPVSASNEGDMELAALQLHHVLLQTYHESQAPGAAEDGASDSSGETITSDSGRGGSDEDISNSNMLSGNSMDDSRAGHNGSFQSNVSTFCQNANLKSSVKDPVRSSARKHVTFKDMERFRNSIRSQNGGAVLPNNDLAVSTGAQPVPKGSAQGVNIGTRGHQNPLSEMNIPVARDNSNVRIDNHNLSSYPGHVAPKPRGVASPSYSENQGRDSPKLVTFSTSAPLQPYQHFSHPRLPSYSGEDTIPSPMPKESNIEWRQHPQHDLTGSKLSINSAPAQPYLHMNSSRDRLPPQHHNFRSQSPQVFPAQPYNDTITRNTDQKQILSKSASKDNNWGTFQNLKNPHRDGLQLPHSNSFNSNINGNLLPPRLTSPLPVIPPREAVHLPDKYSSQPSLHGSDVSKYPTNTSNKMAFLTERFAMPSRDWTNESIATTEDGDDQRSTTTSGSYSIDHEDEYLAMEFKPKDIVV